MENEIENEEGGITLGYIFRMIFSQKWLALIIAVIITVAGTLGLYFMGKSGVTYSVSFVLQLPKVGDASPTSYTYPDGESFYYTDLISAENLRNVAKREGFGSVDVDKMIRQGDISISRTTVKLDATATDGVFELNYKIKVKASYFDNEDSAREFIESLTMFPREYIAEMDINYDQSLTTSKSAITYEEQLNLLKSQAQYIQSIYGSLSNMYSSEFVTGDGRTLAQCKSEIDAYLSKDLFSSLINRARENRYIKSGTEEKLKYESNLYTKSLALERAVETLNGLNSSANSSSIIYDEIIALNREIATLRQEISIIEEFLQSYNDQNKIAPADFEEEIRKVEATVTKFTEDIKPVASYVYSKVTKVNYLNTSIVEVQGGRGLIRSAVMSLVVGLVVAVVVAYIVGWAKYRKMQTSGKITAVPVYGEAQLQIAATNETEEETDENTKKDKK